MSARTHADGTLGRRPTLEEAQSLVERALAVESQEDLDELWSALDLFAPYRRPVGDRWGNRGLFTAAGGNFDLKLTELITNMHDAVLLRGVLEGDGAPSATDSNFATLFRSPRAAVDAVFGDIGYDDRAKRAIVELRSAGEGRKRERTVVFRDRGIGMTAEEVSRALFHVGSSRKDGIVWLLGAFGRGGLTVLPNCHGLVVVSRTSTRADSDLVVCAVRWERVGNRQTETALYQVVAPWDGVRDESWALTLPSESASGFDAGTHLAVVGFRAEGIWVSRLGDERSLDTIIDTRLFEPALPVTLATPALADRTRSSRLRGLGNRLTTNPRSDRLEGADLLPFRVDGTTYHLPVRFYLFAAGDVGARRRFVARDHALLINSNGQAHAHWTPAEFRHRTNLPKLADRILVVMDADPLPLGLRTSLFTADRTELLRQPEAVRLEAELIAFLNDWEELLQANNDMIRDAIRRSNAERSTAALAERIGRVVSLKANARVTTQSARPRDRRPPAPRELLEDPTTLVAPEQLVLERGRTHGLHLSINAKDRFIPARATCSVTTTHLDIDPSTDITIGELKRGRLRVSIAVPSDAELTEAQVDVRIDGWLGADGGLREGLDTTTEITVVEERETSARPGPRGGSSRPSPEAVPVAVIWSSHHNEEEWTPLTAGEVDHVSGDSLGGVGPGFDHLVALDDVSLVRLNEEFAPLKAYASMRARTVGNEGVARAKERYALGLSVELLLSDTEVRDRRARGEEIADDFLSAHHAATARGVLAVLPDFDALSAEIGLDED